MKTIEDNAIQVIAAKLINHLMLDQSIIPYRLPELTFEDEIKINIVPNKRIFKMGKKEHINSFFNDGSIQLGCFNYFNRFDHAEIGDKTESSFILVGRKPESTSFTEISGGFNHRVFCTYLGDIDESCINKFGYDAYFEILDPISFAHAIQNAISSKYYEFASCVYKEQKIIIGTPSDKLDFNVISSNLLGLTNKSKYFVKPSHLLHQSEFRFIWQIDSELTDPIIVKCPEAIKFCREAL